jgi:predicted O-methyltransferase YrrM
MPNRGSEVLKRALRALLRIALWPAILIAAPIVYLASRAGIGIDVCRRVGFHPVRLHYYQPIPRYESVPESTFTARRELPGVHVDPESVRTTLKSLARFGAEATWTRTPALRGIYTADNQNFGFSSAALLHTMIRSHGTRKVVEIGGGYSSLITLGALEKNRPDGGYRFVCVEPYPFDWLAEEIRKRGRAAELINRAVEQLDPKTLTDLDANDILFIDSSHCVRLASDVNFLFLQVLPRLKPGVIVHVHDVYIPYEYPRVHFYGRNKLFWNEQYLLEAMLSENPHWDVILPGYLVQLDMEADFEAAFPHYDPSADRRTSSFWLRRVR